LFKFGAEVAVAGLAYRTAFKTLTTTAAVEAVEVNTLSSFI